MSAQNLNEKIWFVVAQIPRGRVATYGQVARMAGYPGYARYVGATLKKLPAGSSLPWHRVVNAQGKISFPTGSEAYEKQRQLLQAEGIEFNLCKLSLKVYGWS